MKNEETDSDSEDNELEDENEDSAEFSELEKEFKDTYDEHHEKIDALVAKAEALLEKAAKLSEKHGVPFRFNFYGVRSYVPEAFESGGKFAELDPDFWGDLTSAYFCGEDGGYAGWQYSRYC